MLFDFVLEDGPFFFSLRAKLHTRDELAKILVAGAGSDEERKFEFTGFQIFDCRLQIG